MGHALDTCRRNYICQEQKGFPILLTHFPNSPTKSIKKESEAWKNKASAGHFSQDGKILVHEPNHIGNCWLDLTWFWPAKLVKDQGPTFFFVWQQRLSKLLELALQLKFFRTEKIVIIVCKPYYWFTNNVYEHICAVLCMTSLQTLFANWKMVCGLCLRTS